MSIGTAQYDAIVIGVGGMGSAACYHLASQDAAVLGLEQFDIPHARGSSHGVTRIIRKARYIEPAYVSLLERAYELWADLDAAVETPLWRTTGYVAAGPTDGDVYTEALASCQEHGFDYEVLDAAELRDRFPGYELPEEFRGVLDPAGGFLHAEQCIVAHAEAAMAAGAEIRAREAVREWTPTADGGVRVETETGTYSAERLVVTAGAWVAELVPSLAAAAVPERQVLGWFQPTSPERFTPETFPVFSLGGEEGHFYGFPVYGQPGFKVGKHNHFAETVDPEAVAEPNREDEAVLRAFTERYFPAAAGPTMALKTCLFTNSPDEDYILDRHPDHPQVVIGAGFSGHGFKMATAVGELLANLALDHEPDHPLEPFSIKRF